MSIASPSPLSVGCDLAATASSAPAAAAASPLPLLYSHAIESILSFVSLRELSAALSVDRVWHRAVVSMAPISGVASRRVALSRFVAVKSPLRRHIAHIGEVEAEPAQSHNRGDEDSDDDEAPPPPPPSPPVWTVADLELLAERIPRLQSLHVDLALLQRNRAPPNFTCVLPAALRSLRVSFCTMPSEADWFSDVWLDLRPFMSSVMESIAALPELTALDIDIGREDWRLTALADAPALRHLTLRWACSSERRDMFSLSNENAEIIRRMSQLHSVHLHGPSAPAASAAAQDLCVRGHAMHSLQSIRAGDAIQWWGGLSDGYTDGVANVPTLTELSLAVQWDRLPTFLGSLLLLRDLRICFRNAPVSGAQVAGCLLPCRSLTNLELAAAKLSSVELASIVESNPSLTRLSLSDLHVLDDLTFLDSAPMRSSLRSLMLESCVGLHIAELTRVDALRALEELRLFYSFIEGVSEEVEQRYKPPCKRIPTLRVFKSMSPLF